MANIDLYLQGTDEQNYSTGPINIQTYSGVIDVSKVDLSAFASGDVLRLVEFEQGAMYYGFDAEITEALVNITNTDMGNTISSATDPDDYVDAQTDTAVGRFSAYGASNMTPSVLSADGYIAASFVGTFAGAATGKIAWSVVLGKPAKLAKGRAEKRTYPN
jgi:hypothetical protein